MAGLLRKIFGGSPTASMLAIGATAPDFEVKDHTGLSVSLANLRGKKVVLWFYPKADTPHCTVEGRGFCSRYADFESRGVAVLGVSFDDAAANKAFAEKFAFPYPLLCDTDRRIGMAYGACANPSAKHASRISYVIDENGIIRHAVSKVDPTTHPAQLLALIG